MSRLEALMAELCPDGVEVKELSQVLTIKNGKDYKGFDKGDIPVYGTGGIMTFIDRAAFEKPSVLIPRKGSIDKLYYVDVPFWTVDTIFYTDINTDIIEPKYVFYYLQAQHLERLNTAGGVPSLTQAVLNSVKIPLPPLPVQGEIVRILDNFTELTAELTAELSARKKQYEYYSKELLSFSDAQYYALADLCDIVDYRGKTPKKVENGVFLVTAKNIRKGYIDYEKSKEYIAPEDYEIVMRRGYPQQGDVLITTEAPCGNIAQIDNEDIALAQRVIKYRPKTDALNSTFLKYILLGNEFQDKLLATATGGTVKGIKGSKLHKLTIPVPPLEVQARIVAILDRFDTLCNDLTSGLPAEITARQQQYEYYRDQLLTFKACPANKQVSRTDGQEVSA
ncbi:restriction endonuclease subunit S [Acetobacterium wieringae]|uniref:restriction endonuclease subunit S n=1 Tax=Acetobacterium wieringae TaxID=52694 RepID=UPI002034328C|nr:restriction endonuclease subunit S [Acetobacterium wieringae]URN85632.1 restriction endonuclease subunit S [Acetobacterium wieringae]